MQLVRISLFQSWNWEESTFEVFDWIQVLYRVTWFPVPGNVTKRVSSNGVHLHIKNSKLFDVNMIPPFNAEFILCISVIGTFDKSRDLFYFIDGFR